MSYPDVNKFGLPKSQTEIFLTIANWRAFVTKDDLFKSLVTDKYGAQPLELTKKTIGKKKLSKDIIDEIKNIHFISILTRYAEPKRFSDLMQLNTHLKSIQDVLKPLDKFLKLNTNNHIENVVIGLDEYIPDFSQVGVGLTAFDLRKQLKTLERQLINDKQLMLKRAQTLEFFSLKPKNPNISKRYSYLVFCLIHLWEKVLKQKLIPKQLNTSTQKNHPAVEFVNEWLIGLAVAPTVITYTQVRTLIREAKQNPDHKYIALRKFRKDSDFWDWVFNVFPLKIPQDSHTKKLQEYEKQLSQLKELAKQKKKLKK
jgi:hypothetical protein